MNRRKLNPWNWFRHEERPEGRALPVRHKAISPMRPLDSLLSLHQEIDRLFDDVFRSAGFQPLSAAASDTPAPATILRPAVDIDASDEEYRIRVEVPGVEEKDLDIALDDEGTLRIRGEKKRAHATRERYAVRMERAYGAFERVLAIPDDVDPDRIRARFRNGVLTVHLPRRPGALAPVRHIPIEAD